MAALLSADDLERAIQPPATLLSADELQGIADNTHLLTADQLSAIADVPVVPTPNELMARAFLPQNPPPPNVTPTSDLSWLTDRALPMPSIAGNPTEVPYLLPAERLTDVTPSPIKDAMLGALSAGGMVPNVLESLGGVLHAGGKGILDVANYISPSTVQGIGNVSAGLGSAADFLAQESQNPRSGQLGRQILGLPVAAGARLASLLTDPQSLAEGVLIGGVAKGVRAIRAALQTESEAASLALAKAPESVMANLEEAIQQTHGEAVDQAVAQVAQRHLMEQAGLPTGGLFPTPPPQIEQEAIMQAARLPTKGLFTNETPALVANAARATKLDPEIVAAQVVAPPTVRLLDLAVSEPISVAEGPGLLKQVAGHLLSKDAELKMLGPEGQASATIMKQVVNHVDLRRGDFLPAASAAYEAIPAEEDVLVKRVLEGQRVTILPSESAHTEEIASAATALKTLLDDIIHAGQQVGLKVTKNVVQKDGTLKEVTTNLVARDHYFPQTLQPEVRDGGNALAKEFEDLLVLRGYARDRLEARVKILSYESTLGTIKDGHLEYSRLMANIPEKFTVNGREAIFAYIEGAMKRIAQAEIVGPNNESLKVLVGQLKSRNPRLGERMDKILMTALGQTTQNTALGEVASNAIRIESSLSMYRSFIANGTEPLQAGLMANMKSMGTAFKNLATNRKELESFYLSTGRITDEMGKAMQEELGVGVAQGRASRFLSDMNDRLMKLYLFAPEEQANALLAVGTMRAFAKSTAEEFAAKQTPRLRDLLTRKLGLNPDKILEQGGRLTDRQVRQAVIFSRNELAIGRSIMNVPEFTNSPIGRQWFLFKSFSFRNGKFLKDQVWADAVRFMRTGGQEGRIGPLLTAAVMGQGLGEVVGDLRALAGGQNPMRSRKGGLARVWDNYMNVFGLGFIADAVDASRFPNAAWHFVSGKPVGDAIDVMMAIRNQGMRGAEKEVLSRLPYVGPPLRRAMGQQGEGGSLVGAL